MSVNNRSGASSNSSCTGGGAENETDGAAAAAAGGKSESATPLTAMSLNMEFYQQYNNAKDKPAYENYLQQHLVAVDVLCVQEDLWEQSDAFLLPTKPFANFTRIVSSFEQQAAHDKLHFQNFKDNSVHYDENFTSTLGNSIYVKSELLLLNNNTSNDDYGGGGWTVTGHKVVQISSDLVLPNGVVLGCRCVVCATLECQGPHSNAKRKPVQILCTHLSGGRFEDQYMEDPQMAGERRRQMQHCLNQHDPDAHNILVGDFNASATKTAAMDGYWKLLRQTEPTQQLSSSDFYSYMMAPFTTLLADDSNNEKNWSVLYETLDGPTSRFGHVVDYFVTSPQLLAPLIPPRTIKRVRMIKEYMDWVTPTADEDFLPQKNDSKSTSTLSTTEILKESITDHNGVQVTFFLP